MIFPIFMLKIRNLANTQNNPKTPNLAESQAGKVETIGISIDWKLKNFT